MGKAYSRRFIVAQGHHIGISVGNMAQVSLSEPSSDIMQQSEHIRFFRVHAGIRCDFFGTVSNRSVMVDSWFGIEFFGFFQQLQSFLSVGIHLFRSAPL